MASRCSNNTLWLAVPPVPSTNRASSSELILPTSKKVRQAMAAKKITETTAKNDTETPLDLFSFMETASPKILPPEPPPSVPIPTDEPDLKVYTVGELSKLVKQQLERGFNYIQVKGEVSGLKRYPSGHLFFNLKDEQTLINAVCFADYAGNLTTEFHDGEEIVATGRLSANTTRSNYQLLVETVRYAGIGAILHRLELLKQQLSKEGLFDPAHKLSLPAMPQCIGIITSDKGAVIQDMSNRLRERFPLQVWLYPVTVQGKDSARQVMEGVRFFQTFIPRVQLIIIARGGGSLEDLLPFSDEQLLRQVYTSRIPIVSAIGHETDYPLLDLVADLRAPTPTAAIELITPLRQDLHTKLQQVMEHMLQLLRKRFVNVRQRCQWQNKLLYNHYERLSRRISNLCNLILVGKKRVWQTLSDSQLKLQQQIHMLTKICGQHWQHRQEQLLYYRTASQKFLQQHWQNTQQHWLMLTKLLQQNNHALIMRKGYSIVYDAKQCIISSPQNLQANSTINVHFRQYNIQAVVQAVTPLLDGIDNQN